MFYHTPKDNCLKIATDCGGITAYLLDISSSQPNILPICKKSNKELTKTISIL